MPAKPMTRRVFLKTGCLTMAAAGLTVCGIGLATPISETDTIELLSKSYGEPREGKRILVAYATGLGSTIDVAVEIGKTLGVKGLAVDVKPIQDDPQLDNYQALVIGSAVRYGTWLPEAVDFVSKNQQVLANMPAAVFCVHICNLGDDSASRQARQAYLDPVRALIDPVGEAFFAGKFDRRGASLMIPDLIARLVPPMDMRKWEKISEWVEGIGPQLLV
ncbi:MAG: hypothetical protein JXA42_10065 [Anaerolineales bacterium]|nr:hypothetical protein [Anaerolineales bacterium]